MKFPLKAEPIQAANSLTAKLSHLLGRTLVAYPLGELSVFRPRYGNIAVSVSPLVVLQPREHIVPRRPEWIPVEADSFKPALPLRCEVPALLGYSLIADPIS